MSKAEKSKPEIDAAIQVVGGQMDGGLCPDILTRKIFATDASVYQQIPAAVAFPKSERDIGLLIGLARKTGLGIIPRTAGTSLAGQVVGNGIVVDVSRYFTRILEINAAEKWVRVQPGVIRNELNLALAEHGLFFAPETSTANRAMIGGMLGNNSCGANSIVYGTTRDQTISVSGWLSDGNRAIFGPITNLELDEILRHKPDGIEQTICHGMVKLLGDAQVQQEIRDEFPKPDIHRRNTGYAIDAILNQYPFNRDGPPMNLAALIAGSEGTLFFATEITLRCHSLPPSSRALICAHFSALEQALKATPIVMRQAVFACELLDRHILEGASRNLQQRENLKFVSGDPAAILLVEVRGDSNDEVQQRAKSIASELKQSGLGYAHPVLANEQTTPVWELRKAGLGVLSNAVGDRKPVAVIEDTAVSVADLAEYTMEVGKLLKDRFRMSCVYYGHAGAGELHLRPILDLKTLQGVKDFRAIADAVAGIVKKYRGSLSGEHGDGRLRGEFLEKMIGRKNCATLKQIKSLWDPHGIFNPGKIVDAVSMDQSLRFDGQSDRATPPEIETVLDFTASGGILRAAEMCNGSGDCRKTHLSGGTMCPSYMATRNEQDTTRARANLMRQVLTGAKRRDALNNQELDLVMDLCLSCKGCKNECPSNVDMAKLKAEFLQARHDSKGIPWRTRMISSIDRIHRLASRAPWLHNFLTGGPITSRVAKWIVGFHPRRQIPRLQRVSLRNWYANRATRPESDSKQIVILFCDEFTNYLDTRVGIAAIELLEGLGYFVKMVPHLESGRAAISKGMLRLARKIADQNVELLSSTVSRETPLLGIEPSALLTLVDEYPALVSPGLRQRADDLAQNSMLVDHFLARKIDSREINATAFGNDRRTIRLHGHCHQKALTSLADTVRILQLPRNYQVRLIPSGCCGMAGSFGYEREHYDVSMQIGELVLFPTLRKEPADSIIAAPGTSCRHQIWDGTGRRALHPVEILRDVMNLDNPIRCP